MAHSQVASWLIPPLYDNIFKVIGADLIVTDSVGETSVWTFGGKRVFQTSETLFPFQEDVALVTRRSTTEILGFVSTRGEYITLDNCLVVHEYPYFSERLLAVKSMEDNYCYYIDKRGRKAIKNCVSAYPFCNGFAKCEAYQASQKKGVCDLLLDRNGQPVKFTYNGRRISNDDVNFISSVNDDSLAILVANKKVYFFDSKRQELRPVFASEDETNLKHQAEVEGETADFWKQIDRKNSELTAKSDGKDIVFRFNGLCQPVEMIVDGSSKSYTQRQRTGWMPTTTLEVSEHNGRYGIYSNDKEVLPPQFGDIPNCFDNKAFVIISGKYGLLQVKDNEFFEFSMNKGNDIAFRHQRVETTLRVDMPSTISAASATVEMDPESGCEIDVTSVEAKTNSFGSSLLYGCMLTIPEGLSDETTEVEYEARVSYDGLVSTLIPFKANEWYYKYFNIDVEDVETVIKNGNLFFTFNISADKLPGEEDYPSTVSVKAGTLPVKLEKLSETRYKCNVTGLREGVNQVIIQIQEPGCPLSDYPFEVSYTKPAPKSTGSSGAKENVVIKNNSKPRRPAPPQPAKKTRKPRLEI
ncbi:MAG: hypothetical protein K6C10_11760 [Prevotella sp.]|nr:hypothetical protein [Prevotella sp.]